MALTSLKLSHIQLVFKQLVLLYSIRHGNCFSDSCHNGYRVLFFL